MFINRAKALATTIRQVAVAVNVLGQAHNRNAEAMERLAAKVGLEWSDEAHDWVWQVEPGKVEEPDEPAADISHTA